MYNSFIINNEEIKYYFNNINNELMQLNKYK